MKNIEIISESALCTGCGSCSGVCPADAILMKENTAGFIVATVNNATCTNCNLCLKVCPSNINNDHINNFEDIFKGSIYNSYIGYANDNSIRSKAQSGGIVTALLLYMLEKKIIEGAVINHFNKEKRRPQVKFADTLESIIKASGSYYSQTPMMEEIIKESKNKKIAAVVLGCQAESINIIKNNLNIKLPLYTIGLICAGQNSGFIIDDLFFQAKVTKEDVTSFRFRDKQHSGWPGNVCIKTKSQSFLLPISNRIKLKPVYESYRCLFCYDKMNVFSDITCGDPWGVMGIDNLKDGYTIVIARTEKGQELLNNAVRDGVITLKEISMDCICKGQNIDTYHKTKFFAAKEVANNCMYPYPYGNSISCSCDKIMKPVDIKKISKRMSYCFKLFNNSNNESVQKEIKRKKKNIEITRALRCPILKVKRIMRKVYQLINL